MYGIGTERESSESTKCSVVGCHVRFLFYDLSLNICEKKVWCDEMNVELIT